MVRPLGGSVTTIWSHAKVQFQRRRRRKEGGGEEEALSAKLKTEVAGFRNCETMASWLKYRRLVRRSFRRQNNVVAKQHSPSM